MPGGSSISRESEGAATVICSRGLSLTVEEVVGHPPDDLRPGHAVFHVSPDMLPALKGVVDVGIIFDRYWVCTDNDPLQNELMISSFFDDLSEVYREIVEPSRNADNVRHLLWLLLDHLGVPAGTLLDFGCGPGASRPLVTERGRSVVGVDLSPRMRELAAQTGMNVLAPEEVETFEGEKYAGGFASYVVHLDPRPADLLPVLSRFRPGGILVANVHKDRGLKTLRSYLDDAGCDSVPLPPPNQDVHGSYLAIHARN